MRLVEEIEYIRRSTGAMVRGRQWFHGSINPSRRFSVLFGSVDADDVAGLLRIWVEDMVNGKHAGLFDASGLVSVTFEAFSAVGAFLNEHRPWLNGHLMKQALVRPSGLVGTIIAGYYRVFSPPCPYEVVTSRAAAIHWLGWPEDALAKVDETLQADPILSELRLQLERELCPAIERVARSLSMSPRTLQRRLGSLGTSFSREVTRSQLNRAMLLLRTSDEKISVIAHQVGCRSVANFSEMFTREMGTSPSQWRAEHSNASIAE